jgi:hypothetical protein
MSSPNRTLYILPKPEGFQDEQAISQRKRQRAKIACDGELTHASYYDHDYM